MTRFLSATIVAFFFTALTSQAQESTPKSYVDQEGKLYWNKHMPVYLFIGSTPSKADHMLENTSTPEYANPHYLDTEGINFIRSKDAFDIETQRIVEPRIEVMYEVYADGLPPLSAISLDNAPRYTAGGNIYYGKGLTATVTSKDQISGVEQIFYKINTSSFSPYQNIIDMATEGEYAISFYAKDNVGNAEQTKSFAFIVDTTHPESNLNINGITDDNVIAGGSKIYILTEDNLSGVRRTYYKFDDEEFKRYSPGSAINFSYLEDGTHTLTYYSDDNVDNTEAHKTLTFYYDKTAPLMAADVLGDRFVVDDQVYFSGRTKLKLTAVDNKVGVKEIRYSIDGGEFGKYDQPFYLPSVSGEHTVRYYSIDNMENQSASSAGGFEEFKHTVNKIYVDLTGPSLSNRILGKQTTRNDTLLIGPTSRIRLSATDGESGLKSITYSINRATAETTYSDAFNIEDEGAYNLEYFGYDNVNNRNVDEFHFQVDATAPSIFFQFTVGAINTRDGLDVYPSDAGLFIAATDRKAGLANIYYSINGGAEKAYGNLINGLRRNKQHTIKARAIDRLGNESESEISFYIDK